MSVAMGRPEPYALFAQTFIHSHLDEFADEVTFAEPIIITACEFLEQNASSSSPAVTLLGVTSPPSFALEAFVLCQGENRFRRLGQAFLYSHSSSNVLEVEAVVTNRFVVRGCYRSLSLVIYGNTARDLGQFNIEFDLDNSMTDTVCVIEEEGLEDLPATFCRNNLSIENYICPLKKLSLGILAPDISVVMKQFLQLTFKLLELPNLGDSINKVVNSVIRAASSHATRSLRYLINSQKKFTESKSEKCDGSYCDFTETRTELLDIYNNSHQNVSGEAVSFEFGAEPATSKGLMNIFCEYFNFGNDTGSSGHPQLSWNKNAMLWLSVALFLCSGKESCYHFVNGGSMKQLRHIVCNGLHNSSAVTLMILGVVERATRFSIGCEGFLGWWPREDETVPSSKSEGYNQLLKLLLQNKRRHDVASLSTFILHRLRFYEVASRYEYAVLSVLGGLSSVDKVTGATLDMLSSTKHQLKNLLKLLDFNGSVEDPSLVARARRALLLDESKSLLSYKATSGLITALNSCFPNRDIDPHLLFLLKERGFLPLSAAILASSTLRSEVGHAMDLFLDISSYIKSIILSLLYSRSGLLFLLLDPELASTVIFALRGIDSKKEDSVPLRYASVLISKGFFCDPWEVGTIVETHLRVVNAIDCLISSKPQSEELLCSLLDLCRLSRSKCGRQALLAMGHFPEAIGVLIAGLHSVNEVNTVSSTTGASPLNLAIFHSAVEIFEVIITDPAPTSLRSWIEHANELSKALHSSSLGSSRKDGPIRLLEWIDASVVYHKTGVLGLLCYAALLSSGRDTHTNTLASDAMDADNVAGDISGGSDGNLVDNLLGKPISNETFVGVMLRDTSMTQLTTAFRILALVSDNSPVAAALYNEGTITVIHAILVNCAHMLERSSNNYDYLVDEGSECNSTSDLLLERNREQGLVDLMIPTLVLLNNLLKKLQEAKEQYRNTKLLKALLQLHREVSPKLATCSADLFYPYPDFALGLEAVCHLLASSLSCWALYGWTPGLFDFLLESLHATSMLALGPKETCSLFYLLNDLLPEEGIWHWKNGMPILRPLRTLAVRTLLGPDKEREIDWYLQAGHPEKLLTQLTPQLEKIAQIILHYATSTLVVIQDMLRVFIVRVACLSASSASVLLQPMILWVHGLLSDLSVLSDIDAYKAYRLLDFLVILLENQRAKTLLLKEGAIQMLSEVLEICIGSETSGNQYSSASDLNATLYKVKESAESLLLLLQKSNGFDQGNIPGSSKIYKITNRSAERVEDYSLSGFSDKLLWECPENSHNRVSQKRKISSLEGVNRQDSAETTVQSALSQNSVPPPAPIRRDTFRTRKPNGSRPPSMHVDDYIARKRNFDGPTSNVITLPRVGATRSTHVDEFVNRERARQHPVGSVVSEATTLDAMPPKNEADAQVAGKSKKPELDLDDDLNGIDIVFDAEESDPDDKLPFPEPDDNIQQPAAVIVDQSPPHSIVGERESQFSDLGMPLVSNIDESTREPRNSSTTGSPFSGSMYNNKTSGPSVPQGDSRMPDPSFYLNSNNLQQVDVCSRGFFDQKFQSSQPPLPPMPPPTPLPPTIRPLLFQNANSVQSQPSPFVNSGPPPLLPPTPPPFPCPSAASPLIFSGSTSILMNLPISLSSIHQLQPLEPPQQVPWAPLVPAPLQDHFMPFLQNPVQLQMLQRPQVSPTPVYYPTVQQENLQHAFQQQQIEHTPMLQVQNQQGNGTPLPAADDIRMLLQHYFSSPQAIQSLLSDRDKLCQLLEQYPKLMQILQERLGQP